MPPTRTNPSNPDPLKHWSMILFESLSVGITAIMVVFGVALLGVCLYVQVIWPLTEWDMVNVHLGSYLPTVKFFLIVIFMAASLVGFWFISGLAWNSVQERRRLNSPPAPRPRSRVRK
jgi:hypothetical protein